ncbi:hypothetical protein PASE110613_13230 [Paenibacillus sediminis]|uniref:Uncharacterized protein n=1 Tax=Paenibacillus sediminis TaxID=664909 RepID=A0ABS4H3T6_9BACL|nr:hypothetical protein [Paenibacillus sediminis]MBP1937136.1 hypothetical protein [Paenibacillus sediminis]
MTIVNISDISAELLLTVLFFLIIIAPLISLGILRLFESKKKVGLRLIGAGVLCFIAFEIILSVFFA